MNYQLEELIFQLVARDAGCGTTPAGATFSSSSSAGRTLSPMKIFFTTCDVLRAIPLSCQQEQLRRMVTKLSTMRDAGTAHPSAEMLVVTLVTSGAILCTLKSYCEDTDKTQHSSLQSNSPNNNNIFTEGEQKEFRKNVEDGAQTWEAVVMEMLSATPAFTEEVRAAASYAVAHWTLQGAASTIWQRSCAVLHEGQDAEGGLDASTGLEVLAQCTALLVACTPYALSGLTLAEHNNSGTQTERKEVKGTPQEAPKRAADGVPLTLPIPTTTHTTRLRKEMVVACLGALGASSSSSPAGEAPQRVRRGDAVPTAVVCQRVLIPLLLLEDGDEGDCGTYRRMVYQLLHSLALGNIGNSSFIGLPSSSSPSGGGAEKSVLLQFPIAWDAMLATYHNTEEVVLLVAALFEFLFEDKPDGKKQSHESFRFSPLLWSVLCAALYRSLTMVEEHDAGQRANMQLRAEYLLKRLVHLCTVEEEERKWKPHSSSCVLSSSHGTGASADQSGCDVTVFSPLFYWYYEKQTSEEAAQQVAQTASSTAVVTRPTQSNKKEKTRATSIEKVQPHVRGMAKTWADFFLILESLHEYGWHIIEAVMPRLDALTNQLEHFLTATASSSSSSGAGCGASTLSSFCATGAAPPLPPTWLEALYVKLMLHPNVGVRRVGLRRIWRLPNAVLRSFSAAFVFRLVQQSGSDPRLCLDIDRVPITATFMDVKAFEGAEVKAVPDVEPMAKEMEEFYARVFLHRWENAKDASTGGGSSAAVVPPALAEGYCEVYASAQEGRTDGLKRMLAAVLQKPPRFTVCVFIRVLHGLADMFLAEGIRAAAVLLGDAAVVEGLTTFARDSVQENVPFWLDVRVTAIFFSALMVFAATEKNDPYVFRRHAGYWKLCCLCGPLGESGGRSVAAMDACGQCGVGGSSLEESFLQERLWCVGREAGGPSESFISSLLGVDTFLARTEELLRGSAATQSAVVDLSISKAHFFLFGALARRTHPEHLAVLRDVVKAVTDAAASLQRRAYLLPQNILVLLSCFVELHHSVGSVACAQLLSWDALEAISSGVQGLLLHVLEKVHQALCAASATGDKTAQRRLKELLEDNTGYISSSSGAAQSLPSALLLFQTDQWDALAAALASVHAIGAQKNREQVGAALHVEDGLAALMQVWSSWRAPHLFQDDEGGHLPQAEVVAVVAVGRRNIARAVQSLLSSLLFSVDTSAASPAPLCSALPTGREQMQSHLAFRLSESTAAAYLTMCMQCKAEKAPHTPLPSALTSQSWSSLLAQETRFVYNVIYLLAQHLPLEHLATDAMISLIESVATFAVDQLDECWTMNLASLYDLILWAASTQLPSMDYLAMMRGVWEHMREVGSKQLTRLCTMAFSVLNYVMPFCPEEVTQLLQDVLEVDLDAGQKRTNLKQKKGKQQQRRQVIQTTDREVYLTSLTACLQVRQDPAIYWPLLQEVLLHTAIFFNTNRDEEENESTVAVTEPLLWRWPEELRMYYPPTVRMAAVGRAMALSTILHLTAQDTSLCSTLTMRLLRMNTEHSIVSHEPCLPNSNTHRTRLRVWQLICALEPFLTSSSSSTSTSAHATSCVEEIFSYLMSSCFTINNMGSVRRLMELYAIRLLERVPSLYTRVNAALANYNQRPQVCGSYVLISCHALLHHEEEDSSSRPLEADEKKIKEDAFQALFPRLLQQSTSNQHLLRIISHIGVVKIATARVAHHKTLTSGAEAILDYITHAPEHIKFREKHEDYLFFDVAAASTPRAIFCTQRKEANVVLSETIPAAAFERVRHVETELCCLTGAVYPVERYRVRQLCEAVGMQDLLRVFEHFSGIPHTSHPASYYVDYTTEATALLCKDPMLLQVSKGGAEDAVGEGEDGANMNIQKKVSSWWTSEVYNELHPRALRTTKQSIIMVATLLENPVNIAGLCRCGDIFAAEKVVVPDRAVFEHPHFIAAARSAELWVPWDEVPVRDLAAYLEGLRRQGYTIVGVEQTANSVSMEKFSFPERCAVVLGAEGQGVPAPLIPLLDVCVEIPQYGLIRSLNVHVTGAIAMYEYTRQYLMNQG